MKFWQLISYFRDDLHVLEEILCKPEWIDYLNLYKEYENLVTNQNRFILDSEIPTPLCIEALSASKKKYILKNFILYNCNSYSKYSTIQKDDIVLSPVDIYLSYGGDCLEDIEEYGSYNLSHSFPDLKKFFA